MVGNGGAAGAGVGGSTTSSGAGVAGPVPVPGPFKALALDGVADRWSSGVEVLPFLAACSMRAAARAGSFLFLSMSMAAEDEPRQSRKRKGSLKGDGNYDGRGDVKYIETVSE